MGPLHILFMLFLVVPLVEIWLLITVGSAIGAGWTVFLVVLTAVIGAVLVRAQGLSTLARSQALLRQGELPAIELLEGAALLVAGALLLTPGFFTDAVGFALLVPWLRRRFIAIILRRNFLRPTAESGEARHPSDSHRTLDGEYRRLDD